MSADWKRMAAVEARCDALSPYVSLFTIPAFMLPNGEAVGRYAFIHAVQNVCMSEVIQTRPAAPSNRERAEEMYGERAREAA
jgi:hypothetical protein